MSSEETQFCRVRLQFDKLLSFLYTVRFHARDTIVVGGPVTFESSTILVIMGSASSAAL